MCFNRDICLFQRGCSEKYSVAWVQVDQLCIRRTTWPSYCPLPFSLPRVKHLSQWAEKRDSYGTCHSNTFLVANPKLLAALVKNSTQTLIKLHLPNLSLTPEAYWAPISVALRTSGVSLAWMALSDEHGLLCKPCLLLC